MKVWDCFYWPSVTANGIKFAQVKSHTKEEALVLAIKQGSKLGDKPGDFFVICTDWQKVDKNSLFGN